MDEWRNRLKGDPFSWLLSSNPWTRYNTLVHLMNVSPSSEEAREVKQELLKHPLVTGLIREAEQWLPQAATRNNDPKLSYFQLRMLSDFGLDMYDAALEPIIQKAVSHQSENMFAVRGEPPATQRGGREFVIPDPSADVWHVSPCNSPVITNALLRLKYTFGDLTKAVEALQEKWNTQQGWFCHFFFVESQFKKLQAGCPMAGIMALDVFSQVPELKESQYAKNAFEPILFHRDYGKTLYYFGRSKKFFTMKYPFVWYNALYLADVLTRFEFLKGHDLVRDLIRWIEDSQDETGRFKANSVFLPYKDWDFGNKKEPSPWITYLCCRILKQWYN